MCTIDCPEKSLTARALSKHSREGVTVTTTRLALEVHTYQPAPSRQRLLEPVARRPLPVHVATPPNPRSTRTYFSSLCQLATNGQYGHEHA